MPVSKLPKKTKLQRLAEKPQQIETILAMVADGTSMYKAANQIGINASTFLYWCGIDNALSEKYAKARESLVEKMAGEILEIADAPVPYTQAGAYDTGAVNKQRLQVDTRKWLLSKMAPRKYGDKLELSGDPLNPVAITAIERYVVDNKT